jgi:DNA polymerase-4
MMWGVGPATRARLAERGIATIGDLARTSPGAIARLLGSAVGERLAALAWNRDPRAIRTHVRTRSVGAQSALGRKPVGDSVIRPALRHLADRVGSRLRAKGKSGRTVTVRVRFGDLRSVTHAVTLPQPVAATAILAEIAEDLVRAVLRSHPDERAISLLAISVSHIEEQPPVVQLDLPLGLSDEARRPGATRGMAHLLADRAIDTIRDRFGWESVGYASVALDGRRSVPDAFRELAEREL